jgi:hypothetical protein
MQKNEKLKAGFSLSDSEKRLMATCDSYLKWRWNRSFSAYRSTVAEEMQIQGKNEDETVVEQRSWSVERLRHQGYIKLC